MQRVQENDADHMTPQDMVADLREDNNDLTARLKETHGSLA